MAKKTGGKQMEVIITNHSIKRYRERTQAYGQTDDVIEDRLRQAVLRGRKIKERRGDAWEVYGDGIYLIVHYKTDQAKIITCLGSKEYRKWSRRHARVA